METIREGPAAAAEKQQCRWTTFISIIINRRASCSHPSLWSTKTGSICRADWYQIIVADSCRIRRWICPRLDTSSVVVNFRLCIDGVSSKFYRDIIRRGQAFDVEWSQNNGGRTTEESEERSCSRKRRTQENVERCV
jgi:hypothetical protein